MITCIKELNQPRYLSVGGAFEAYSKPLVTMTYETLKDHPDRQEHHRPGGFSHQHSDLLYASPEGAGMMLEAPVRRLPTSWPASWPPSTSSEEGDKKMAFNSADTAAFKNVWVFCEQRQGVMMPPPLN